MILSAASIFNFHGEKLFTRAKKNRLELTLMFPKTRFTEKPNSKSEFCN